MFHTETPSHKSQRRCVPTTYRLTEPPPGGPAVQWPDLLDDAETAADGRRIGLRTDLKTAPDAAQNAAPLTMYDPDEHPPGPPAGLTPGAPASRPALERAMRTTSRVTGLLGPLIAHAAGLAAVVAAAHHFPGRLLPLTLAAAAALALHGFTLWSLRGWLAEMGLLCSALRSFDAGNFEASSLWVSGGHNAESRAWNQALAELTRLRDLESDSRLGLSLAGLSGAGSGGGLDRVFDTLPIGVLLAGPDHTVQQINGAAARLLQITRDEARGRRLDQLTPDGPLHAFLAALAGRDGTEPPARVCELVVGGADPADRADRGGNPPHAEADRAAPDRCVIRTQTRRLGPAGDGRASRVIVLEDVTQQRAADHARHVFVAQATHELRTPLTNVSLYLQELLEIDHTDAAERSATLNIIMGEVSRLDRLIHEVLEVSEVEAGSFGLNRDDVDLLRLLTDVEREYSPRARSKGLELRFELPPKIPTLQADVSKLGSAIHNLIGNALKYTPEGGSITVTARLDLGAEPASDIDAHTPGRGEQVAIVFADTGIGIAEDELDAVFEKFGRASNARDHGAVGTGLGLPLAREIARLHGGDVTARSTLGRGSTFTLTLPVTGQTPAFGPAQTRSPDPAGAIHARSPRPDSTAPATASATPPATPSDTAAA